MRYFKIILDGRGGVGKTSMLYYLTKGYYIPAKITVGVNFSVIPYDLFDQKISIQFWDFGGLSQFDMYRSTYYYGASAMILTFDLTRYTTFESLDQYIEMAGEMGISTNQILLVGCKMDLSRKRVVYDSEIERIQRDYDFGGYIEASARTGANVRELFELGAALALYNQGKIKESDFINLREEIYENLVEDVIEIDETLVKKCYYCGKPLNFYELCGANPDTDFKALKNLWESPHIQFYCCNCFRHRESLVRP